MRILAIDPGPRESAFVVWDGAPVKFGKVPNEELITGIIRSCIGHFCDHAAIEMIGHYGTGMPAGKDVFDTCCVIGDIRTEFGYVRARHWSQCVSLVLRATVKAHICGTARARDGNIRQALIDRFGGKEAALGNKKKPGPLYGISGDEWQALGLAVCWFDLHWETCHLETI